VDCSQDYGVSAGFMCELRVKSGKAPEGSVVMETVVCISTWSL
jgi:hypothetical protein